MNNNDSLVLNSIVEKLKSFSNIKNIILFGSFSNDSQSEDSDIDLCILIDDNNITETDWSVRNVLFGSVNRPIDLLIYNRKVFKERANSNTSLESRILNQGITLYG